MGQASDVAARFDRVSEVYDETREPLSGAALDRLASILSNDGCGRLLEAGIGTGRIARPLQDRGFDVTGVDLSRGMLQRARGKGLANLALADANHLPFVEKSFDAAMMSHVLHLLENPAETFGRLAKAARREVVILLRKRDEGVQGPSDERLTFWQTFRKVAEEAGYTSLLGPERWRERFRKEADFVNSFPPSELITIEDVSGVTTLGHRLSLLEKRAYGFPSDLSDGVFLKLMERLKSTVDLGKEIPYRRVEQVSIWRLER
ncbi:MAG TPA: class I SAM-dependent methyltransferase [Nitrososphaerales archaeon]|nr:class I SAM-dependent methyltransferase [Nitrososphaerales archaeon]